jgi:transposase
MMFARKKKNKSGSISVQILKKEGRKNILIQTVGSSKDSSKVEELYQEALRLIPILEKRPTFNFLSENDKKLLSFSQTLNNANISVVGAKLVFGTLFDRIGFDVIKNPLFKDLVLSRILYQGSKLKLVEYLRRYEHREVSIGRIYRFLDKLNCQYKEEVEAIAFRHTQKILNTISVVFYDMTTLYFEAQDEDDFRKIGFSKDGKFQNPQIMLGLLVGEQGYPIGYELFEGNTFEGHTLIPVLEKFQEKFHLRKPIVVADSGLLSRKNIQQLKAKGYTYILGARIKNTSDALAWRIMELNLSTDGAMASLEQEEEERLIITYSDSRAKKDRHNRQKGLARLEKKVRSGMLNKEHINARGYNKYLRLSNEVKVEIDYRKFEADGAWDGLKGYTTNATLPCKTVVENYANLWHIEKAFRMSKSDLQIRPIYHYTKRRIEAHISISFVAYTLYKELERLLYKYHAPFSIASATDLAKTMYQLEITLPDSKQTEKILLNMDEEQKILLQIIHNEFG